MQRLKHFALLGVCLLTVGLVIYSLTDWSTEKLPGDSGSDLPPASSESSSSAVASGSVSIPPLAMPSPTPVYEDYSARTALRGTRIVLFFASASDPFSMKHDALLRSLSASGMLKIPVYRLDFGSSTGSKVTYAVVVPDTFVVLDVSGQRSQSLIHPSSEELLPLLTSPR